MRTINRRDYLKHMGIGAGAIVAGEGLNLFAHGTPTRSSQHGMKSASMTANGDPEDPHEWQPSWPDLPSDKCVKLIFDGLMGFCPRPASKENPTVQCDVGIQSKGDSDHHHRLFIHAYQTDHCKPPILTVDNVEFAEVKLKIEKPDTTISKGVAFYQPAKNVASRMDLQNYPGDWRWIVDFESNYLYRKHLKPKPDGSKFLKKNKNVYKTMFTVTNGLFYTLRKTASTFRAQTKDGTHVSDLGNVADVHGANIYLMTGGKVTLTVKGKDPVELVAPAEIYFSNRCLKDPDVDPNKPENHCAAEPDNLEDKTKRNDFYLNYKAFDRGVDTAQGTKEYELYRRDKHDQTAEVDVVCEKERFAPIKFTDEAPCAGSGFGGGGGLPPFP